MLKHHHMGIPSSEPRKVALYLDCLQNTFPDLAIASATLNDTGQNSDAVIVNGEMIFRFPKYAHVIEQLKTETAILTGIQGRVPLNIPRPEFVHLDDQAVGEAFTGYRMIPGEPLWRDTFRAIDDEGTVDALAAQLAGFLRALHGTPVSEIPCDLPVRDTYHDCADLYGRMRAKLFETMRPDARAWAADHFEKFLHDERNFMYQPVLKHGDFGPSNILFDHQTQRIAGIIDFGSSCLGDPAYDFAGLLSGYGEPFVDRCCTAYPEVATFYDRTRFYQGTFALLEALFGIENDDPGAFQDGMASYV